MSLENNSYIILSQVSIVLPVYTGIMYYRQLTKPHKVLLYFFIAAILFEVQASITKAIFHNNMPGLHFYTLVEFLTFSYVYYHHFQKNNALRLFIGINMIVFVGVSIADAFFVHNLCQLNPLSRSYSAISLICYALAYFYFLFRKDTPEYNSSSPMFWINIGVLIYFASNTLYFMLATLFMKNDVMADIGLFTHATLNIITNCLYAQSFRCFREQQKAVS